MCSACAARLNLDMCSSTGIAANVSGTPTASPSGAAVRLNITPFYMADMGCISSAAVPCERNRHCPEHLQPHPLALRCMPATLILVA